MPWFILVFSGVFEAVWATALGASDGFRAPGPTLVFAVAVVISMGGLGWAAKSIPIGTAYAAWAGIGASVTVIWAMATGIEPVTVAKSVFLLGIIGSIVGLKLLPSGHAPDA